MTASNRNIRVAGLLAAVLGTAGCSDFLTGPGLSENPNQPVVATATQLFIASQAQAFVRQEGQLARTAGMFVQQLSGTFNQQLAYGSQYLGNESDYSGQFSAFYTGGGLVDWRKIQEAARTNGDAQFEGIAQVWEAFTIGTAADIWGDVAYREAIDATITKPHLDPQQQVYGDMQALLSTAITKLGGTGPGPAGADLVYAGNTGRWIRAAHTLKARYHLHTAERLGAPAYQAALAEALLGINEAPANATDAMLGQGPGDLRAFHGQVIEQSNLWSQFLNARQDIVAGNVFIQALIARSDPRLGVYFAPVTGTTYRGANQFGTAVGGSPSSEVGAARRSPAYRQPFVSWAENQLIIAEAKFQLSDATAITNLNNVRTSVGLPALVGPITLADIMTEKWIVMFQNIEAWSDYRRTCIPVLSPGGTPVAAAIPGRLPYGLSERQNNPNVPAPAQQPVRNWNDPNPCTGS